MEKKVAIMQPYFLPYIGYFQLIKSVDEFILYDNIQYTKSFHFYFFTNFKIMLVSSNMYAHKVYVYFLSC